MEEEAAGTAALSRRTLLRRGAVVGGSLLWTTPVVQSMARPAFASASCSCVSEFTTVIMGTSYTFVCELTDDCCACLCAAGGDPQGCTIEFKSCA